MGVPSNKNVVLPLEGLFAPIPATPGLACVVCLDGEPEPRGVCCWESHSLSAGLAFARRVCEPTRVPPANFLTSFYWGVHTLPEIP